MRVRDVMSVPVVSVGRATAAREVVRMLVEREIGGVPVCEDGRVIGIVTRTDLLEGVEPAQTAADLMTRDVVTMADDLSVARAARLMRRYGIKRAPVVRDGRVIGFVTQADLLRPYLRTDSEIRCEIESALNEAGLPSWELDIAVDDGVVTLAGQTKGGLIRTVALRLARAVEGVVDVIDHMTETPVAAR